MIGYTHGEDDKYLQNLVIKAGGKIPHGKPRHRSKNNIEMNLKEIWW
jgi:hypothetical protein